MLEVSRRAAGLAEEINAPEELWKAQDQTGIAFHALGQPVEARRNFLAAISTIESLRHEVAGGGQQRQGFLENKLSPWLRMLGFHRQLRAPAAAVKSTKAEALRLAALKLMKNPETSHPFYWAGFVLVGDGR